MNNRLQQICEGFVDNGRVIRENFVWNDTYLYPLISMMYTLNNRKVNTIDLRDCKGLIIKESTMLAGIRGMSNMAWTARLAQYEHPRTSIDQIHDIYGMLREEFKTCQNLANVAFQLFELCDRDCYENVIQRTQNIYKMTKQSHPMLNSNDHLSYIVLLALSDKEEEKIVEEIEQCLELLMEQYSYTNGVQALSLVLALGQESCESRVWKSIAIYEELLHRRLKIGKGLELASIGVATFFLIRN